MSKKPKSQEQAETVKLLMLDLSDPKWASYEGRMNNRPFILHPGVSLVPVDQARYLVSAFPFLFTDDPEKIAEFENLEKSDQSSNSDPDTSTDSSAPTDSGSEE